VAAGTSHGFLEKGLQCRATLLSIRGVKKYTYILASFISVIVLVGSSEVLALTPPDDTGAAAAASAPLLITEVQAGTEAGASEEFIELYNASDEAVDFGAHAWKLQFASSAAKDWTSPLRTVPLTGLVHPHGYYVAASQYTVGGQTVRYLADSAAVWFTAGLTAGAGHVQLVYQTNQRQADGSCASQDTVADEVEWSLAQDDIPATPSLDGRNPFLTGRQNGILPDHSLQRGLYGNPARYADSNDDTADFATNGTPSPGAQNIAQVQAEPDAPLAISLPEDACEAGPSNTGTGGSGDGTGQSPEGDQPPDDSTADSPPDAADNEGLLVPQLSELLPNPAAPQTDGADEFIELYNPNDDNFDLSGYMLAAGTSTMHTYVFPEDTLLAPSAYQAFFSADTGLSLSNSGGQVSLENPAGNVISQSDAYGAAKDGQAWALVTGTWQWTEAPTPNAANQATAPAATVKAATTKAAPAAKKPAAAKTSKAKPKAPAAKAKKSTAKAKAAPTVLADAAAAKSPLHPVILATVVGLAVLYGAYEYRHDLANYFRRLREHRAHRRANRQAVAGRRDD
jgi:hypothetical protein